MVEITVKKFYEDKKKKFLLNLVAGVEGLSRKIKRSVVQRPSFILAGYTEDFAEKRLQIMGTTEISYLSSLSPQKARKAVESLFHFPIPALIISKGMSPPDFMVNLAEEKKVPLFVSTLSTEELFTQTTLYLDSVFAPKISIHGTMMDVYGVGILYIGRAGIGKSECALDLVERGHRLVADDVVMLTRRAGQVLIAKGAPNAGHFLEIRGVGIVDIERLFGIRAIRIQKRVELEVHLELWENTDEHERIGLDDNYTTCLGVEIPKITIPISPGKNITAISEAIAMNHMLKVYGYHPAKEFMAKMQERMRRQQITEGYLESDFE